MNAFWEGFEKQAARKTIVNAVKNTAKGDGFFGGLKRMGGEAIGGTGRAMDSVGQWIGSQGRSLNAMLPKGVQTFNTNMVNRIKANPVKSAVIGGGLTYGAGRAMGSPSQPSAQYNNYVM